MDVKTTINAEAKDVVLDGELGTYDGEIDVDTAVKNLGLSVLPDPVKSPSDPALMNRASPNLPGSSKSSYNSKRMANISPIPGVSLAISEEIMNADVMPTPPKEPKIIDLRKSKSSSNSGQNSPSASKNSTTVKPYIPPAVTRSIKTGSRNPTLASNPVLNPPSKLASNPPDRSAMVPTSLTTSNRGKNSINTISTHGINTPANQVVTSALASATIVDQTERNKIVELNITYDLMRGKNKKLPPIPDSYITLLERKTFVNSVVRDTKIKRGQRKSRRFFALTCLVVELWLTNILGINMTGLMEDQLDELEFYDDAFYQIQDQLIPKGETVPQSPWLAMGQNFGYGVLIVGAINFLAGWVRSYHEGTANLIMDGKGVIKKLIKDDSPDFDDDNMLKTAYDLVTAVKNMDLISIASNPKFKPLLGMLSNFTNTPAGTNQAPAPSTWSTPATTPGPSRNNSGAYNL